MADQKVNINYLNKDFSQFKTSLVDYAKTYFPTVYNDFTPSSPGMMFMEMSAYIGDVLSFYLDNQIQETFLQYTRQQNNLYELAYVMGYRPKVTSVATVDIDVYQQVPAIGDEPDYDYALFVNPNTALSTTSITSNPPANFLIQDSIDFTFSSSADPTEVTLYRTSPNYFLLKKTRKAISAEIKTKTFSITSIERFKTLEISDSNIIGILDIVDSDGNTWYEVPYLAQETIYDTIKNSNPNNPNFSSDEDNTPYLLQLKKVQRRFVTRFTDTTVLQIQFGAGTNTANTDEEIIPNPDNVGLGLPYKQSKLNTAFSPSNFLFTDTYGIAPNNTTLTVRYLVGGGLQSNVTSNIITNILNKPIDFKFQKTGLSSVTAQYVYDSIFVSNPFGASGGGAGDSDDDIRLKSLSTFITQQRTVTQDDYLVRALSLPSEYGTIAKAYIETEKLSNLLPGEIPSILNLFILSYDIDKKLETSSDALKQNLSTYLSQYRMINDSIKIKNAFIINIGVDFEITVLPQYNNNLVLTNCITALQDYFNIDKWQINEPIMLRDLYVLLDKIEGVQTVKTVTISNKTGLGSGYSSYSYDIAGATYNNIIYPSLDPMVFEVKYPDNDIKGRVVTF
jgi:hypothetical protein